MIPGVSWSSIADQLAGRIGLHDDDPVYEILDAARAQLFRGTAEQVRGVHAQPSVTRSTENT